MAVTTGLTITGMDEVLKNLRAYGQNTKEAAAQALYEEASAIKAVSQARYVPVRNIGGGELRGDHAFIDEAAKVDGDSVSITFGYSGPYAASVHENPRAGKTGGVSPRGKKYKRWAEVGEWKYLEKPLLEAESGMLQRLAGRIRSALGGKLAAAFYGG